MIIYVVILNDEPIEIGDAYISRELAQADIDDKLSRVTGPDFYWLQNRLSIKELRVLTAESRS